MDRKEALAKVEQMDVAERIEKLSEPAMAYVKECVEQAVLEEQQQPLSDTAAATEHEE